MNPLSNTRQPGESAVDYRERRRKVKAAIDKHLQGKLVHESSKCVTLPALGENAKVDEEVQRGLYRRVTTLIMKGGKAVRLACTKGITFRKPKQEKA
jgi:hypothetical protein